MTSAFALEPLHVTPKLSEEFATIVLLWKSQGTATPFLDATILSWVKYEKQLRRLFSFLVYQHPCAEHLSRKAIDAMIVGNPCLYPDGLITEIESLGGKSIANLVGQDYELCCDLIKTIKRHRGKFMHGQLTGESIRERTLQAHVRALVKWIELLAIGAEATFGYDGLERKTWDLARCRPRLERNGRQFESGQSMLQWIDCIDREKKYITKKYGP